MNTKTIRIPYGGLSLITASAFLLGIFLYVFLGSQPVTSIAALHAAFGLNELISLNALFGMGHTAIYGLFTLVLCRIFSSASSRPAIAATLLGTGVAVEVLQEEFFGRQFQLTDVLANTTGIAVSLILLSITARRRRL